MKVPTIGLYIVPGDQHCAAVLLALRSRNVTHTKVRAATFSQAVRKRTLPSADTDVPEMLLRNEDSDSEREVVTGSAAIIRRIDELVEFEALCSLDEAVNAQSHINTEINALLLYYTMVSEAGWIRSTRAYCVASSPPVVGKLLPYRQMHRRKRAEVRVEIMDTLRVGNKDVGDRPMLRRLVYELARYESALEERGCPRHLYGTALPSAADCALYGMLLRFTERVATIPPALPDLFDEAGLGNLKNWFDSMRKEYPIDWSCATK